MEPEFGLNRELLRMPKQHYQMAWYLMVVEVIHIMMTTWYMCSKVQYSMNVKRIIATKQSSWIVDWQRLLRRPAAVRCNRVLGQTARVQRAHVSSDLR